MRSLILLLIGFFAVQGQTQELDHIEQPLRFTIGYPDTDPRFAYVESIFKPALAEHNIGFELVGLPAGREFLFATDDSIDGVSATLALRYWPITTNKFIALKDPFITVRSVAIAHKNVDKPTTWEALNQSELTVVYVRHHYSAKVHLTRASAIEVSTIERAIKLFLAGRADVILGFEAADEISTLPALVKDNIHSAVLLSERPLYTFIRKELAPYAEKLNTSIQKQRRLNPLKTRSKLPTTVLGEKQ